MAIVPQFTTDTAADPITMNKLADAVNDNASAIGQNASDLGTHKAETATQNELGHIKLPENWKTPTLLNGWVNFDEVENNFGIYKDDFGRVHIRGSIRSGAVTAGTIIANLPLGYRPERICILAPITRNSSSVWSTGNIYISTSGDIVITIAQNNKLILDGISFRVGV